MDGHTFSAHVEGEGRSLTVLVDGRPYFVELPEQAGARFSVRLDEQEHTVILGGRRTLTPRPPVATPLPRPLAAAGAIAAPMAGRIMRVAVSAGDIVGAGDLLLILEAMKMENEIRAPTAGQVTQVLASAGQRVAEGDVLLSLDQPA